VKKKVLIVGINSFIGKNFAKVAKKSGFIIYGTSRKKGKKNIFLDLSWPLNKWPEINYKFDCILICASESKIKNCQKQKNKTYKVNVLGTKNIIKKYKSEKTQTILISTSHVFNGKKKFVSVNTTPKPQNNLGKQKLEAENIILNNHGLVIRATKIYESTLNLFKNWVIKLYNNKKIKVFSNLQVSFIPLETFIKALVVVIRENHRGILHLSGPEDKSYYEILKLISKKLNLNSNLVRPTTGSRDKIGRKHSNTVMKISKPFSNEKFYLPSTDKIISKNINAFKKLKK
tara:strand:+ start:18669 stop:19532 length:864 start_codon:yes stop_codon:yes gene_type:complete